MRNQVVRSGGQIVEFELAFRVRYGFANKFVRPWILFAGESLSALAGDLKSLFGNGGRGFDIDRATGRRLHISAFGPQERLAR